MLVASIHHSFLLQISHHYLHYVFQNIHLSMIFLSFVCLQTAVMWDLLTASFTSWLSQELSYSQTCIVTIKHLQISMMNTDTHWSLHNKFETHRQTDFQHNSIIACILANIVTFSLAPALLLDSGPLSAVWRRGAQHDNWITITNQCWVPPPPPRPPDLCTLTLTPAHLTTQSSSQHQHSLTEKLDIFIASVSG